MTHVLTHDTHFLTHGIRSKHMTHVLTHGTCSYT